MALSKNCKSQIMKTLTGKSQQVSIASSCYIGLLSAEPGYERMEIDTEIPGYPEYEWVYFTHELEGAGYQRMLIGNAMAANSQAMSDADENGTSVNTETIFFPEAEENWGTATYFALFNSATGGEPHLWGRLTSSVAINEGYVPIFKPGSLSITLT